jgi:hypothetical protein
MMLEPLSMTAPSPVEITDSPLQPLPAQPPLITPPSLLIISPPQPLQPEEIVSPPPQLPQPLLIISPPQPLQPEEIVSPPPQLPQPLLIISPPQPLQPEEIVSPPPQLPQPLLIISPPHALPQLAGAGAAAPWHLAFRECKRDSRPPPWQPDDVAELAPWHFFACSLESRPPPWQPPRPWQP